MTEYEIAEPFIIDSPVVFDVPPDRESNILTPQQLNNASVLPQKLFRFEHNSVLGNRTLTIQRLGAFYINKFLYYFKTQSDGSAAIKEYNSEGTLLNNIVSLSAIANQTAGSDWVAGAPDLIHDINFSPAIRIDKGNYIVIELTSGDLGSYGSAYIFGFDE